ncbi:collagen alpha-6(VI) chain [Alligator mississippiensis]|uniref:collagen alpha-6(VI) chain n=1 Tax=Alligator mississippiensis TaxID=8496 RepID=UPI002877E0AD|nr:collagen alpha-6(VI) chain [Alligator mississippiensis]
MGIPHLPRVSDMLMKSSIEELVFCILGKRECPVYPTELAFALDLSQDVSPQIFQRMKDIVISIVNDLKIRDSNCPVGARVAILSYNLHADYLIRFSEVYSKKQLLNELKNLDYQRSSGGRDIGSAMRFVARNVFKRTLQGPNVRKIAVFFSNGPSADASAINTAVLELSALDVAATVIAFLDLPSINRAFVVDDSGLFHVINTPVEGDYKLLLKGLHLCTLCYDKCKPDDLCKRPRALSWPAYVDATFILDSSQKMSNAEFGKVKDFLSRSLDVFDISSNPGAVSTGDRVAVVSHAPPGFKPKNRKSPVKVEFSLITYNSKGIMRNHIEKSLQQLNGEGALGHAMEWTMKNIFSTAPKPRSHKVIIVISAGETSPWDREILKKASVRAKCQGYAVFVISLGQFHNAKEVEELTSIPLEQHLVQLGRTHKPELDYAEKFVKAFVRLLRGTTKKYPPEEFKIKCDKFNSQSH